MAGFILSSPPASEPVTLAEVKQFTRIDGTDNDALVTSLIVAARQWAENFTGLGFINQGWQMWLDQWPCGEDQGWWDGVHDGAIGMGQVPFIKLPRAPVVAVSVVTLYDDSDVGSVWAVSNYYVDMIARPARLCLRNGASWPLPARKTNGIKIDYTVGFGTTAASVPEPIKIALRQLVTHWYDHRSMIEPTQVRALEVPMLITALLEPYRMHRISMR